MMTGKAFRHWVLMCVSDKDVVAIDEGGLTIVAAGSVEELQGSSGMVETLELGGIPEGDPVASGRASHTFRVDND